MPMRMRPSATVPFTAPSPALFSPDRLTSTQIEVEADDVAPGVAVAKEVGAEEVAFTVAAAEDTVGAVVATGAELVRALLPLVS